LIDLYILINCCYLKGSFFYFKFFFVTNFFSFFQTCLSLPFFLPFVPISYPFVLVANSRVRGKLGLAFSISLHLIRTLIGPKKKYGHRGTRWQKKGRSLSWEIFAEMWQAVKLVPRSFWSMRYTWTWSYL